MMPDPSELTLHGRIGRGVPLRCVSLRHPICADPPGRKPGMGVPPLVPLLAPRGPLDASARSPEFTP